MSVCQNPLIRQVMPALRQKNLKAMTINNILLAIYPLYLVLLGGSILVFYNFWLNHIGEVKISKDILIRGQQEYVYPEAAEQFTFILAAIYTPLLALFFIH
jgi:hypothetical protein